jgi:hypothetical protein
MVSVKAEFFNIGKPLIFLYMDVQEALGCFSNQKCSQWEKFGGTLASSNPERFHEACLKASDSYNPNTLVLSSSSLDWKVCNQLMHQKPSSCKSFGDYKANATTIQMLRFNRHPIQGFVNVKYLLYSPFQMDCNFFLIIKRKSRPFHHQTVNKLPMIVIDHRLPSAAT